MSKHILVVYYSQSGQLKEIARNFAQPFTAQGHDVEFLEIKPVKPFDFPWTGERFFDAFPESVLGIPAELHTPFFKRENYDLIILAYQPWYLSPGIPFNSFLQHPEFVRRAKNTPVITLIGARNMWIMAQEKVKVRLSDIGAKLVGNVVLTDRHTNLVSAITIQYWMFTGKKDRFLGFFPRPGVSGKDIASASHFGEIAGPAVTNASYDQLQEQFIEAKAVEVKPILLFVESRGAMLFKIWASLIIRKKNRKLWLRIFKYYLVVALFVVSPLVILIYIIILRPVLFNKIRKEKQRFLRVNQ
jgi:hypothetical protein